MSLRPTPVAKTSRVNSPDRTGERQILRVILFTRDCSQTEKKHKKNTQNVTVDFSKSKQTLFIHLG